MYVCGPTVYNRIHLGNARPMVVFDALARFLAIKGYNVEFVSNFTDVDDKIIALANDEGVDFNVVAKRFIDAALEDARALGCATDAPNPKVTEEMPGIIEMIKEIADKGFAYEIDGTVYFDTAAKADYGKLSHRKIDDLESGARIEVDTRKKQAGDFVLWKPAKDGEPYWDSPWGRGRPGWHIECSCMIRKYLGTTIDIHAGGMDLIFPHHENELAQSEAANDAPLARYWMHNGMINVAEEKMSKSESNFFMVNELAKRYGYAPLRLYILSFHYRSPINFAPEHVESAKASLARIVNCAETQKAAPPGATPSPAYMERFMSALEDDFNTADAIGVIFDFVKHANTAPAAENLPVIVEMCNILGINLEPEERRDITSQEVEAILAKRAEARKNKNWAESDLLRDQLLQSGVVVKDTPDGVKWHYDVT